jgi:inhibitor of cysteine peptidase
MDRRWALLPLAVLAAGCATVNRDEVAAPPDGGELAMRVGTALVVSLPPDPATGYGWVLASASPNLYFVGGPDYTPAPKPRGLVGVADTTAFRFRARGTGTGTLEFNWLAPPGQPPAPQRTLRYDVTIAPNIPDRIIKEVFGPGGFGQVPVNY